MFVSFLPISLVAVAKQVLGVGYMTAHLQQKKSILLQKKPHTHTVCASTEGQSQDPPQGIYIQQFSEKNRKCHTNFLCGEFHQSTASVVRSFLKLFVILFKEMLRRNLPGN